MFQDPCSRNVSSMPAVDDLTIHYGVVQSSSLMKLPPRETTAESDLTIPFQQSASKSTADQDPFFLLLKLRFLKPVEDSATPQVSSWSNPLS